MEEGDRVADEKRVALFISHASPEDNPFTIWLGAKLAALGYEVWADVLRLRGGEDWQRKLENALRHRACKVLLVANQTSVEKQGVRNEIQIASSVAKTIDDDKFIIPLRLGPFDAPFLIAHAQYIDFQRSWTRGLTELLETLEDAYQVPRLQAGGGDIWRDVQLVHAKGLIQRPERLISNWLEIVRLPELIRLYDFSGSISHEHANARMRDAPRPLIPYRRGFLSFAPPCDLQEHFGPSLPLKIIEERKTDTFLQDGWTERGLERWDARSRFTDLTRRAFENAFIARGLEGYALSDRQTAWWAPVDVAPQNKVSFRWDDISGLRQIQGASAVRNMNWHFGISVAARSGPIRHVRVISRLIFTKDGKEPFDDAAKVHRLRRSFAKTWRNARWRDMLLAFLYWLAEGGTEFVAPTSSNEGIAVRLPPITWEAPISVCIEDDSEEERDDDDMAIGEEYEIDDEPAEDLEVETQDDDL